MQGCCGWGKLGAAPAAVVWFQLRLPTTTAWQLCGKLQSSLIVLS
jgi:hypothetical protein